jgi:hypothetical protein
MFIAHFLQLDLDGGGGIDECDLGWAGFTEK